MRNIYKPQLIIGAITLPHIITCIVFFKIFSIIQSELSVESIGNWRNLAVFFIGAGIVFTLYSIILWRKKKDVHPILALTMLVVYSIFLYIFVMGYDMFIPLNIQRWRLAGFRPGMTMLGLLMPTILYAMIVLAHWITEKYGRENISKDTLFIIGIPGIWYLVANLDVEMGGIGPIVFMASTVAFVFFFIRVLYVGINKKPDALRKFLAPLVLIGSLCGLALNKNIGNIFGDFSHWSFYVLSIITSLLILVPPLEDRKKRLTLFILKSVTFVFSTYFFIIFAPLLPLSLAGLLFVGLGALMLVPLALMYLHVRSLWWDFNYLKNFHKTRNLVFAFLIGIVMLPSIFLVMIQDDKADLDKVLKFTYQRSFEDREDIDIDLSRVRRSLTNIKYMKGISRTRTSFADFNRDIPYISSFYNQYVLDGLSISNEKINRLEKIFFGESDVSLVGESDTVKSVFISDVKTKTEYDTQTKRYRSWIDLELKNNNYRQREYSTVFRLPEGSYISNYYLYVGNVKKYGLIADKRAANWIYRQIRNIRKDPGLLDYIGDNKVSFKVFPFEGNQRRRTGIEITHRSPIKLTIDGKEIKLGKSNSMDLEEDEQINLNQDTAYVTKEMKDTLPKIKRKAKYYFVIDYSKGNEKYIADYTDRIKDYIKKNKIEDSTKEIIALNYQEKRSPLDDEWQKKFQSLKVQGGLFLDYTIKRILYENYVDNKEEYPVIILATNDFHNAVISKDIKDWKFVLPEGLYCYQLDRRGQLVKYSLKTEAVREPGKILSGFTYDSVLKLNLNKRIYYLEDSGEDSIVLLNHDFTLLENNLGDSKWHDGVLLKAAYNSSLLHPEKYFINSLSMVKNSIVTEVMSPLTSYIVLENEAQEKAMFEKQRKILSTKKALDIGDVTEMDEPPFILILGLIILTMLIIRRKRIINNIS
ncbi:MSEP-CTERM sorting domain-containing protein [Wukongibacter baidiensis]|uniref:MSEP-CTERM sorting domain-containing protein n=1 Tax=Wukongibacter baidiensis TaxID=1723361 RepID=UPI003D7FB45A